MKKLSVLFFILVAALLVNGCGKKDTAGTDSGKKEGDKKEDVKSSKDVALDDNSTFHITYKMDKDGKGINLDMYRKGTKAKSEFSSTENNLGMTTSAYYSDNIIFMVMDVGGKKMGMKMDVKDIAKKEGKDLDKQIFDAKERLKEYEKAGKGDVLGYSCDIYKDKEGNTYYFYKDQALLKLEGKNGKLEASKFEPDIKLEDSFFEVPKNVEFMDMGNLNLDKLKDLNVK